MNVDVCICTFRRVTLFGTLKSIAEQVVPDGTNVRVIVADNDAENRIEAEVLNVADALGLSAHYVHAPAFNISIARNACLDAATGDLVLFIDDDEEAGRNWLASLVTHHMETGAGAIFGPVEAVYPDGTPNWILANRFHSNQPQRRDGTVQTGYSGNVLLDRNNPDLAPLRFDEAFGKTGGEDVDFFFRAYRAGVTLDICETAVVEEPVPAARNSLRWLRRRMYAIGRIYGHCYVGNGAQSRGRLAATASVKSAYCMIRSALSVYSAERASFWFLRSVMHLGVVFGSFSAPRRVAYGEPSD